MDHDGKKPSALTRRVFIKQSASAATLAPFVLHLSACASSSDAKDSVRDSGERESAEDAATADASTPSTGASDAAGSGAPDSPDAPDAQDTAAPTIGTDDGSTLAAGAVLVGLYPGDGANAMKEALARLDFSWLKDGDTVLIKVASNSGNPHPATTSPTGVRAMVEALKARGAGRVIVADQAGVEHVRRSQRGRFSSTRERFEANGLGALDDVADLAFFDDGDWESGYFEATLPADHHWPRGLYLASAIKDADHIIYMPRISAHMLAGITTAQKSAIGWLRDDSRHDLHNDAQSFYEKYAEISYTEEIASRFRMVVTLNEQVQLFGGPDEGTAFTMDPPLVLASTSLANHDAVATSILVGLQNSSGARSSGMAYTGPLAATFNSLFAGGTGVATGEAGAWISESPSSRYTNHGFETKVSNERAVARGWQLSGETPDSIFVRVAGEVMDEALLAELDKHGAGLYRFS
ncbi:MAG: DUF362 domain-containing protein [Polyangiales bacterium]